MSNYRSTYTLDRSREIHVIQNYEPSDKLTMGIEFDNEHTFEKSKYHSVKF